MRSMLLLLLFWSQLLFSQELYRLPPGTSTGWSSFENPGSRKGQGGMENLAAKGHPSELVKPGESRELLKVKGPGIIKRIWMTVSDRSPQTLRAMTIEIYWDNAAKPAVSVPLPDFFGIGLGRIMPFENALFSSPEGRSFNCYIPMPYNTAARIVVRNESGSVQNLFYDVDFLRTPPHGKDVLYYHAFWNNNRQMKLGDDFEVLPTLKGRGRLLGVHFGVVADSAYGNSWFGEGEVKMYIDGDTKYPTLVGSGTEDYIGTGWGQGRFVHQFQGCPLAVDSTHEYAFYRYHVPDPVFFSSGIKMIIQQIGGDATASVQKLAAAGAKLIPVTVAVDTGLIKLMELKNLPVLSSPQFPNGWTNFYRVDNYSAAVYFYLDKPVSNLPALPPMSERLRGIQRN